MSVIVLANRGFLDKCDLKVVYAEHTMKTDVCSTLGNLMESPLVLKTC